MEFITELWLPILLSAVGVFVVSSVLHMCIPIHKNDYKKLENEEPLLAGLREHQQQPGEYMFPAAECMSDMKNPEYIERCNLGPVGFMVIMPNGMWNMGKSLGQWFAYSIVISLLTAYVCSFALAEGASFSDIFRLTSTVSFLGYAFSSVSNSIWKGISWCVTCKFVFDGTLYSLATGAIFGWMLT